MADGLVLDWISETIALRIIQEALRNVWLHSDARRVEVTIAAGDEGVVEVRVVDDGVGFDPVHTLFESGIAAMRSFAGAVDGRVTIDSARGAGTSVRATLGPPAGRGVGRRGRGGRPRAGARARAPGPAGGASPPPGPRSRVTRPAPATGRWAGPTPRRDAGAQAGASRR